MSEIENYINSQPKEAQIILNKIRQTILKDCPNVEERFSYNMPLIYLHGNVIWFANYKKHIGIYPEPETIAHFQNKLTNYKTSKGAIQFQKNEEIPYDLIMELVRYRVNKNLSKLD